MVNRWIWDWRFRFPFRFRPYFLFDDDAETNSPPKRLYLRINRWCWRRRFVGIAHLMLNNWFVRFV